MDEYVDDLPGPKLPDWAEEHLGEQRSWHRLLRGTGLVTPQSGAMRQVPPR